jgi:hypothetical protein
VKNKSKVVAWAAIVLILSIVSFAQALDDHKTLIKKGVAEILEGGSYEKGTLVILKVQHSLKVLREENENEWNSEREAALTLIRVSNKKKQGFNPHSKISSKASKEEGEAFLFQRLLHQLEELLKNEDSR